MSLAKAVVLGGLAVALGLTALGRPPAGSPHPPAREAISSSPALHAFELSLAETGNRGRTLGNRRREFHLRLSRSASPALAAPRLRVRSPLGWTLDRAVPQPMAPGESIEIAFSIELAPGLSSICAEVLGRNPDRPSAALVAGSDRLCFDPSPVDRATTPPGKEPTR